ncbi:phage tail protein [Cupriavidus sp. 2TAF22]|uniref:phage tail protein n=1 Tax=unclassified Cupriavidus TaxID=2640874 RepID=UPI003F8EAE39
MSQNDLVIDNQAGASFRADLNGALQAQASQQSGSSAPTTTYPYQFWADTGAGLMRMRNAGNTAWVTIGLLGVQNFGHLLPGSIVFHSKSAAPSGFLKANGGAVSRNTFADLFAEIGTTFGAGDGSTTFNLPELRGEFLRGWDDGRGADSGRTFGSWQDMQLRDHNHLLPLAMDGSGVYPLYASGAGVSPLYGTAVLSATFRTAAVGTTASGSVGSALSGGVQGFVGAGSEIRPRNVGLLACIKY